MGLGRQPLATLRSWALLLRLEKELPMLFPALSPEYSANSAFPAALPRPISSHGGVAIGPPRRGAAAPTPAGAGDPPVHPPSWS